MASPRSWSPWFHHTQGLHHLANLRVSIVSPSSGPRQRQGLHCFAKLMVSMVSPNSGSPRSRHTQGPMVASNSGSRRTQGLLDLAELRVSMVSPNPRPRRTLGLHVFSTSRVSMASPSSGSTWSRHTHGLQGFVALTIAPPLRVYMVSHNPGSP